MISNDETHLKEGKFSFQFFRSFIKNWWRNFLGHLDMKMAFKSAAAAVLSLYMSEGLSFVIHRPSYLIGDLWAIITSVVVLQASIGATYKAVSLRFLGVLIGSSIGSAFCLLVGASVGSIGIAIMATMIMCSLFSIPDTYRLAAMSVVVIMLPWKHNAEFSPWIYAFFRFFDTCLGFISALIISHILWPSRAYSQIKANISDRFNKLSQFLDALFDNNQTNGDLIQNIKEEVEASFNQGNVLQEESKSELFINPGSLDVWININRNEEQLWENFLVLQTISFPTIKETFDENLNQRIGETLSFISVTMKEFALKFSNGGSNYDFNQIEKVQDALTEELIRFRSTHRMRNYSLEVVEDSFVFFYQLRKILIILGRFVPLLKN